MFLVRRRRRRAPTLTLFDYRPLLVLQKSRAEAILERSRQQTWQKTGAASQNYEVVDNAKRFGIQIWNLEKTIKWLDDYKSGKLHGKQSLVHKRGDGHFARACTNHLILQSSIRRSTRAALLYL